jgi:hypothetical protein
MESKLYVYELVISKSEYKRMTGRKLISKSQWEDICEELTDRLEDTVTEYILEQRRTK